MMGIVNVTPDSFYDRGLTAAPDAAVARGLELAQAGAGIIDVGGMTAQPGRVLSGAEEIARVEAVVHGSGTQHGERVGDRVVRGAWVRVRHMARGRPRPV